MNWYSDPQQASIGLLYLVFERVVLDDYGEIVSTWIAYGAHKRREDLMQFTKDEKIIEAMCRHGVGDAAHNRYEDIGVSCS